VQKIKEEIEHNEGIKAKLNRQLNELEQQRNRILEDYQ
jgi:hypothetical protein